MCSLRVLSPIRECENTQILTELPKENSAPASIYYYKHVSCAFASTTHYKHTHVLCETLLCFALRFTPRNTLLYNAMLRWSDVDNPCVASNSLHNRHEDSAPPTPYWYTHVSCDTLVWFALRVIPRNILLYNAILMWRDVDNPGVASSSLPNRPTPDPEPKLSDAAGLCPVLTTCQTILNLASTSRLRSERTKVLSNEKTPESPATKKGRVASNEKTAESPVTKKAESPVTKNSRVTSNETRPSHQ